MLRSPFHEGPEKFSHPESRSKISNLMITELFYSHIPNMKEVLFIQKASGVYRSIHLPVLDTDELKMALRARKNEFPGLSRNGPQVFYSSSYS